MLYAGRVSCPNSIQLLHGTIPFYVEWCPVTDDVLGQFVVPVTVQDDSLQRGEHRTPQPIHIQVDRERVEDAARILGRAHQPYASEVRSQDTVREHGFSDAVDDVGELL